MLIKLLIVKWNLKIEIQMQKENLMGNTLLREEGSIQQGVGATCGAGRWKQEQSHLPGDHHHHHHTDADSEHADDGDKNDADRISNQGECVE